MHLNIRLWLLLLGCAFMPAVHGAEGYWVVLGSTSELTNAEQITSNAGVLGQGISIQDVETAQGRMHRVVAGPFDDRFTAQEVASSARGQGFPDAWLVLVDPATSIPSLSAAGTPPSSPASDPIAPVDTTMDAQPGAVFTMPAAAPIQESIAPFPGTSPADEEQQESTRELLDQTQDEIPDSAPPGYNLNRLRRDA